MLYFIYGLLIMVILTPPGALVRVAMIILRTISNKVRGLFSTHNRLRDSLIVLAILGFIASNILQFIATFVQ